MEALGKLKAENEAMEKEIMALTKGRAVAETAPSRVAVGAYTLTLSFPLLGGVCLVAMSALAMQDQQADLAGSYQTDTTSGS